MFDFLGINDFGDLLFWIFIVAIIICASGSKGNKGNKKSKSSQVFSDSTVFRDMDRNRKRNR